MPSIGVLEAHQKPTDKPTRRIKKSGGQSLVRQGRADWIIDNVLLQMREIFGKVGEFEKLGPQHKFIDIPRKLYIPDKLPPNIDAQLGVLVQIPALPNQVRYRHF